MATQRWPIRLDDCFMRVCLDVALGARWDIRVRRHAIRHLMAAEFSRAIEVAEAIVRDPARLPSLNQQSLRLRERKKEIS